MGLQQNIIFLSDGTANRGALQTSSELLELARTMPNYLQNTIHCLGLQLTSGDLNGYLLKSLSQETSGIYILAHDLETVSTFLGDVMANHLMGRFKDCTLNVSFMDQTGLVGTRMVSTVGPHGFLLRLDRPTTIVFEYLGPTLSNDAKIYFSGTGEPYERTIYETDIPISAATKDTEALIFKAICGQVLDEPGRPRIHSLIVELRKLVSEGSVHLAPLLIKCEFILGSPDESRASANIYDMQALGPESSDTVNYMRNTSLQASQNQDPY
jgi:hypothetical protein